jgi:hypothetical protein
MRIEPVPPETARVTGAAFPKGNRYLRLADELDALFTDDAFRALFPTHGQPAWPPWRLALVTLLQFAEGLSDPKRQKPCAAASIGNTYCARAHRPRVRRLGPQLDLIRLCGLTQGICHALEEGPRACAPLSGCP